MNLPALTATPADAPIEHIRLQYANDGFLLLSGLIDEATSRSASELLLQLPGMDANNAVIAPQIFTMPSGNWSNIMPAKTKYYCPVSVMPSSI